MTDLEVKCTYMTRVAMQTKISIYIPINGPRPINDNKAFFPFLFPVYKDNI